MKKIYLILFLVIVNSLLFSKKYPVKVIGRKAKLYNKRAVESTPDSLVKILTIIAQNTKIQQLNIYGNWYQTKYQGKKGWIHQTDIKPNPNVKGYLQASTVIICDTTKYNNNQANRNRRLRMKKGTELQVLSYTGSFAKVKVLKTQRKNHPSLNKVGWIKEYFVELEDQIPSKAYNIISYKIFNRVSAPLSKTWYLKILKIILFWFLLLAIPGYLGFVLTYHILGRIRFLPNSLLFFLSFLTISVPAFQFHNFLGKVPPYMDYFVVYQLFFIIWLFYWFNYTWNNILNNRCPKCHRINAVRLSSSVLLSRVKQRVTKTTKYSDGTGHSSSYNETISRYENNLICRFCNYQWKRKVITKSYS